MLYTRWEYVDRYFGPSLGLWSTNPDGTQHQLVLGNNAWFPGMIVDSRQVPGTDQIVCIYGAHHDLPWGALTIVNPSLGKDGTAPVLRTWPAEVREHLRHEDDVANNRNMEHRARIDITRGDQIKYEDPWPLSDMANGIPGGKYFLVSRNVGPIEWRYGQRDGTVKMAVFLVDVFGNELEIYSEEGRRNNCFNAMPLAPRPKPKPIPWRVDLSKTTGQLYVNDVYIGDGDEMANLKRGSIKWLRIIEAPEKRFFDERNGWNMDAQQVTAMNWNLTNNKRIIGDVPVEADGSAFFEVPADIFFYFQALDENKMMIQSMRSGTMVRPGEVQGCVGCHESRVSAPLPTNASMLAMKRAPSKPQPWHDSNPFNYLTEVQPVFDRLCVSCHDYGKKAGEKLNLAADQDVIFNISYLSIMSQSGERYTGPEKKLVNAVCDGPPGVLPAYAWGSHLSTLVDTIKSGHKKVKLTEEELNRIITWIDLNCVYYGAYESIHPGRNPVYEFMPELLKMVDFKKLEKYAIAHGTLVSFARPEMSPMLKHLKDPNDRERALEIIRIGQQRLREKPREDTLGAASRPTSQAVLQRLARYLENQKAEQAARKCRLSE